ncbi:hypothetical protein [Luteitalea sp. TBR-22]|uniref:hypothetical protein n=1 Tax=Luteitalea sp. TBR-22 TaxID=2802971 RepID=UPI001EF4860A|nr:hypothetical protein [Luteitalea sp. TBR-22]
MHGWLTAARPLVCVLTDGSGHHGISRLASTSRLLATVGAEPGPVFGRFSDRALYATLRRGDVQAWERLARELAELLERRSIRLVVGDAAEGFNPGHDVCRFVIDAAVALAARHGHHVESLEFALEAAPGGGTGPLGRRLILDDEALDLKIAAARAYVQLRPDVDRALERFGREAFREEWLGPPSTARVVAECDGAAPGYERHGSDRVASGLYDEPLTWRAHVRPVWEHLAALVPEITTCACS